MKTDAEKRALIARVVADARCTDKVRRKLAALGFRRQFIYAQSVWRRLKGKV